MKRLKGIVQETLARLKGDALDEFVCPSKPLVNASTTRAAHTAMKVCQQITSISLEATHPLMVLNQLKSQVGIE